MILRYTDTVEYNLWTTAGTANPGFPQESPNPSLGGVASFPLFLLTLLAPLATSVKGGAAAGGNVRFRKHTKC